MLIFLNQVWPSSNPSQKPLVGLLCLMPQPQSDISNLPQLNCNHLSGHCSLLLPLQAFLLLPNQSPLCTQPPTHPHALCLCPQHSPHLDHLTFYFPLSKWSVPQCSSVLFPPGLTPCPRDHSLAEACSHSACGLSWLLSHPFLGAKYLFHISELRFSLETQR